LEKLATYIKDKNLLNILTQHLKRIVEVGGNFIDIQAGCPLSPVIASFYLVELDKAMEQLYQGLIFWIIDWVGPS
jgi:hypothetical protein